MIVAEGSRGNIKRDLFRTYQEHFPTLENFINTAMLALATESPMQHTRIHYIGSCGTHEHR